MEVLRGYGLGPNLQKLLQRYWDKREVVSTARNLFGRLFGKDRGVTQGNPVSPTIFKIVVDAVVRVFLLEVCGNHKLHHGFGWAEGEHNIILYAEYSRIAGRNPIWVQTTLMVVVRMLYRVGLLTNTGKTKELFLYLGFHLGTTGYRGVQEDSDRREGHVWGEVENQGEF